MIVHAALLALLLADPATDNPWSDYERADPKVVAYALSTPERAWNFIIGPDSPYAERRAVAREAGKVLSWAYMRRIDDARGELNAASWMYETQFPPGDARWAPWRAEEQVQQAGETHTILGHDWTIPARRPPYPNAFEERARAPWPWQVRFAIEDAWRSIPAHQSRESFLEYAASLPCRSAAEARFFRGVTTFAAGLHRQAMPVALIGAWRNVLLRTDDKLGNALSPYIHSWALRFDDRNAWLYAHVFLLDRIEAGDVYGVSAHLYQLRERINDVPGREIPGSIPYTATLAVGRKAMRDPALRSYVRVMAGLGVARALGANYLPAGIRLDSAVEADQPEMIRRFNEWFPTQEKALEAGASNETAALDAARKTLASVTQCRSGEKIP